MRSACLSVGGYRRRYRDTLDGVPRETRSAILQAAAESLDDDAVQKETLPTLASGENKDGTPFALPVEVVAGAGDDFAYEAGAAGQVNLPGTGAVVREVSCVAGAAGGQLVIDGGDPIPIPAGAPFEIHPDAVLNILDFTNTVSFYVQFVAAA